MIEREKAEALKIRNIYSIIHSLHLKLEFSILQLKIS